ncbi:hypothetical protein BY996DRAFT_6421774 [Phakopsora pachyrhizi]|nr:hypothetical protein BY996DRAFT_6421774 [Phakopsora pachyrhizi]
MLQPGSKLSDQQSLRCAATSTKLGGLFAPVAQVAGPCAEASQLLNFIFLVVILLQCRKKSMHLADNGRRVFHAFHSALNTHLHGQKTLTGCLPACVSPAHPALRSALNHFVRGGKSFASHLLSQDVCQRVFPLVIFLLNCAPKYNADGIKKLSQDVC